MQNQQLNSNGKTQGRAELILDQERIMWRNIKFVLKLNNNNINNNLIIINFNFGTALQCCPFA